MASPTPDGEPALRRIRIWSAVLLATVVIVVAIITFSPGPPDPSVVICITLVKTNSAPNDCQHPFRCKAVSGCSSVGLPVSGAALTQWGASTSASCRCRARVSGSVRITSSVITCDTST